MDRLGALIEVMSIIDWPWTRLQCIRSSLRDEMRRMSMEEPAEELLPPSVEEALLGGEEWPAGTSSSEKPMESMGMGEEEDGDRGGEEVGDDKGDATGEEG